MAQHPSTVWFDDLIAVQVPKQRPSDTHTHAYKILTAAQNSLWSNSDGRKKALERLSEAKIQYSSIWGNGCLRPPADLKSKTGQVVYCGKAGALKGAGIDVSLRVSSLLCLFNLEWSSSIMRSHSPSQRSSYSPSFIGLLNCGDTNTWKDVGFREMCAKRFRRVDKYEVCNENSEQSNHFLLILSCLTYCLGHTVIIQKHSEIRTILGKLAGLNQITAMYIVQRLKFVYWLGFGYTVMYSLAMLYIQYIVQVATILDSRVNSQKVEVKSVHYTIWYLQTSIILIILVLMFRMFDLITKCFSLNPE